MWLKERFAFNPRQNVTFGTQPWLFIDKYSSEEKCAADKASAKVSGSKGGAGGGGGSADGAQVAREVA